MSKLENKNEYWELAYKTAVVVSKLEDIKRSCECLTDKYGGNSDPEIDLDAMLIKAARALSSLIIYAKETEDELGKTKKEKNSD